MSEEQLSPDQFNTMNRRDLTIYVGAALLSLYNGLDAAYKYQAEKVVIADDGDCIETRFQNEQYCFYKPIKAEIEELTNEPIDVVDIWQRVQTTRGTASGVVMMRALFKMLTTYPEEE